MEYTVLLRQLWAWGVCYYKGKDEYPKQGDFSSILFAGAAIRRSGVLKAKISSKG